jgi:hypothetical protein
MSTVTMPLEEIRRVGLDALAGELGPVGMVRFLQQFENGSGDYTAERAELLGTPTVAQLAESLQRLHAGDAARVEADRGT